MMVLKINSKMSLDPKSKCHIFHQIMKENMTQIKANEI